MESPELWLCDDTSDASLFEQFTCTQQEEEEIDKEEDSMVEDSLDDYQLDE